MVKQQDSTGKYLMLALAVVLAGSLLVGVYIRNNQNVTTTNQATTTDTTTDVIQKEVTIDGNLTRYENQNYGFAFVYPEEWGEVVVDTSNNLIPNISFSNTSQYKFGLPYMSLLSKSYKTAGGGPSQWIKSNGFSVVDGVVYEHNYITDDDVPDLTEPEKREAGQGTMLAVNNKGFEYIHSTELFFTTPMHIVTFNLSGDVYPAVQISKQAGEEVFQNDQPVYEVPFEVVEKFVDSFEIN